MISDILMQKNESGSFFSYRIQKAIQSKLKTYTLRLEAVKFPEANMQKSLVDIGQGSDFLNVSPKAQTRANEIVSS